MCEGTGVEVADDRRLSMRRDLSDTAIYFLICLLLSIGYAGVSGYVFDFFEPAWGKGGSAQVVAWLLGALGFLAALSFLIGHARYGYPMKLSAIAVSAPTSLCIGVAGAFLTGVLPVAILPGMEVWFRSGATAKYVQSCRRRTC